MSTSTQRMRRMRGCRAGDHAGCLSENCSERRRLELRNSYRLLAIATFDELSTRGMDAIGFLGDRYGPVRRLADLELPDYLDAEPDFVDRMNARHLEDNLMVWDDESLWR
jgi:hypothetical protein